MTRGIANSLRASQYSFYVNFCFPRNSVRAVKKIAFTMAAAGRLHHNHESWAQVLANEVSDDDDAEQYGTLILDGEEEEESLHASAIDVSHATLQAIVDKIAAPDEDVEEEQQKQQKSAAFVEVTMNRKKLVVAMASVVCVLLLSLVGVSRALRRRDAQLEALVKRNQEIEEKIRKLEQEKVKFWKIDWEEDDEEWKVADNCYVKVGFGECTKRQWQEWNDMANGFWGYFEQAWTSSDKESSFQGDDRQDPQLASFPVEAFNELSHAVTRILGTAQDAVSQASHEVSRGILATIDEIMELSRDAVDKGTAYTRLEEQ